MSTASRRAEFFALEANEYLSDLQELSTAHGHPDAERLVRGARALRGAALMAGLGTYARAAAGLEAIARQVRDHALSWEPNARDAWSDGITTLRALVGRAANWEANDDRQALLLAERFDQVSNGRPARAAAPPTTTLTPGVRAFIARESALIAGSLAEASRALAPIPPAAALAAVLERMRSLRGLGASAELSPLPELLDAMEVATRTLLGDTPTPPNVAAVFADAAHALSAMARAVADAGRLVAPPELDSIARRLLDCYVSEADVVPVESLAPVGVDPIVELGAAPAPLPEGEPVPVELVGVGDHLLLVAEGIAKHSTPAARDLRVFVLHRTLSAMPARSATGRFLAPLTDAIMTAISRGVAADRGDAFVAMLRGCGRFLIEAGATNDRFALTRRRDAIAASLEMVSRGAPAGGFEVGESKAAMKEPVAAVAAPALTPAEAPVVDIAALAYDEDEVVPIESLAPDLPPPRPAPVIAAEAPGRPSRLEASLVKRNALRRTTSDETPTLGGLIGAEIVPVGTLLYRGSAALTRADELRLDITRLLATPRVSLEQLTPHLHELLDLVPLIRDAA